MIFFREQYENFETLSFEIHLKIIIDLIYLMLLYGNESNYLTKEFVSKNLIKIEENCLRLMNLSLEIAYIPIKKTIFLFTCYLEILFSGMNKENEEKFITREIIDKITQQSPRLFIKNPNLVEQFYVLRQLIYLIFLSKD